MQNNPYKTPNPQELIMPLVVPSNWSPETFPLHIEELFDTQLYPFPHTPVCSSTTTCTQSNFPDMPSTTQPIVQQALTQKDVIPAPATTEATPNTQQTDESVPVNTVTVPPSDLFASQYPKNLNWNFEDYPPLTSEVWNALPKTKEESLRQKLLGRPYIEKPVFRHPWDLKNSKGEKILCVLPPYKV